MVASECAPVAKAGGLGDVVFGLSRELEIRGMRWRSCCLSTGACATRMCGGCTPCYDDLWVPWYGEAFHCTVYFGYVHGRKCFFIEPHPEGEFFGRDRLYGHYDDVTCFTAFSKAALEFLVKSNKRPDVIHCHDWQTGLVPVLLNEQYRGQRYPTRRCVTRFTTSVIRATRVPRCSRARTWGGPSTTCTDDRLGDDHRYGALNLMKGGIVYSDFVTTVSPNHAAEARYGDGAFGLGHTLHVHRHKFRGILNGVDYDVWNPEVDSHHPRPVFSRRAGREVPGQGSVSGTASGSAGPGARSSPTSGRLDEQKGMELVHHALFYALSRRCPVRAAGRAGARECRSAVTSATSSTI